VDLTIFNSGGYWPGHRARGELCRRHEVVSGALGAPSSGLERAFLGQSPPSGRRAVVTSTLPGSGRSSSRRGGAGAARATARPGLRQGVLGHGAAERHSRRADSTLTMGSGRPSASSVRRWTDRRRRV